MSEELIDLLQLKTLGWRDLALLLDLAPTAATGSPLRVWFDEMRAQDFEHVVQYLASLDAKGIGNEQDLKSFKQYWRGQAIFRGTHGAPGRLVAWLHLTLAFCNCLTCSARHQHT
jgi:hypothetical protein